MAALVVSDGKPAIVLGCCSVLFVAVALVAMSGLGGLPDVLVEGVA